MEKCNAILAINKLFLNVRINDDTHYDYRIIYRKITNNKIGIWNKYLSRSMRYIALKKIAPDTKNIQRVFSAYFQQTENT